MAETEDRPLVTFALFAYNQERYVAEAIEGAFAQDYSPLEIILSDDCSSDATFEIMQRMAAEYDGPHKIVLNRNERNLGIGGHVSDVLELATAQYVVIAAGDDVSLSTRTADSMRYLLPDPGVMMISTSILEFGDDGRSERSSGVAEARQIDAADYLDRRVPHPPGCSRAFRREVFETFGRLHADCPTEDTPFLIRAALLGQVLFVPEVGVRYRRHDGGVSQAGGVARMKLSAIARQYDADLRTALLRGILSPDGHKRLSDKVAAYMRRREFHSQAMSGSLPLSRLLGYVVGADSGLRDKASLVKAWARGLR